MDHGDRKPAGGGPLASLSVPAYRSWFLGQVLPASGLITQSVGAAWLVLQLGGGAIGLALLNTAALMPVLLLGAWGGSITDRVTERRRLLALTQLAFIVLSATLALLSA